MPGVLCASGTVDDLSVVAKVLRRRPTRSCMVHKRFNCGDESGTFDVRLTVRLDNATHYTTASWRLVGGTDAYAGLHGNGMSGRNADRARLSRSTTYYDGNVH